MKILNASQIKAWDEFTIAHEPIAEIDLIQRAAAAAANWILQQPKFHNKEFYIFCGPGNNGADGLAIARILLGCSFKIKIFLLGNDAQKNPSVITNLQRLNSKVPLSISITTAGHFPQIPTDVIIVDALFGTGLNRKLDGLSGQLAQHLNQSKNTIISIDIPSGLLANGQPEKYTDEIIINANYTISFQQPKLAFLAQENENFVGEFVLLNIGLHPQFIKENDSVFYFTQIEEIKTMLHYRKKFSHKYNNGSALFLAGSKGMAGAAVLNAKACYRSGVGLASYFLKDENLLSILQTVVPEAICILNKPIEEAWQKKQAIAIGSGWENNLANQNLLEKIIAEFAGPIILDATALTILIPHLFWLEKRNFGNIILTPHTGEFDRLFGTSETDFARWQKAIEMAKKYNCTIIVKGAYSLIATAEGKGFFNSTGNPGMATAGSGDVLCGIVTSLAAQGYNVVQACIVGAYLHGLAGDFAAKEKSENGLMASDLIDYLGKAWIEAVGHEL